MGEGVEHHPFCPKFLEERLRFHHSFGGESLIIPFLEGSEEHHQLLFSDSLGFGLFSPRNLLLHGLVLDEIDMHLEDLQRSPRITILIFPGFSNSLLPSSRPCSGHGRGRPFFPLLRRSIHFRPSQSCSMTSRPCWRNLPR